ncbi:hypothetical protein HYH03_018374 [Edaphochlamys debaryana]|uniref:Peptidase S8/S53 domain-containing protein n=1 Tax=Edaphochlamys debaryana TaxID=47281 RepID=A0A835XDX1_9CHLO|nr:hypothetical protein HYH03_018374 [Edaphochlamys debaryana]|eukprot:KAG2482717.1 hypothetical protein HYH03_018374 [Edaphochlamys debaryana]
MSILRSSTRAAAAAAALLLAAFALCSGTAARKLQQEKQQATFIIGFNGSAPARDALRGAVVAAGCSLGFFHKEAGIAFAKCPAGITLTIASFPASLNVSVVEPDQEHGPPDDDDPKGKEDDDKPAAPAATPGATSSTPGKFYTGPLTGAAGEPNDTLWHAQPFTGRRTFNPDIVNKFDMNASKSFVNVPFGAVMNVSTFGAINIAGVIAAEANNGIGVVGLAYGATLIGVQVLNGTSSSPASTIIEAVIYAAERKDKGGGGADVITITSCKNGDHGAMRNTTYYNMDSLDRTVIKAAILRGAVLPPGNPGEMRNFFGAGIINVPRTLGL